MSIRDINSLCIMFKKYFLPTCNLVNNIFGIQNTKNVSVVKFISLL